LRRADHNESRSCRANHTAIYSQPRQRPRVIKHALCLFPVVDTIHRRHSPTHAIAVKSRPCKNKPSRRRRSASRSSPVQPVELEYNFRSLRRSVYRGIHFLNHNPHDNCNGLPAAINRRTGRAAPPPCADGGGLRTVCDAHRARRTCPSPGAEKLATLGSAGALLNRRPASPGSAPLARGARRASTSWCGAAHRGSISRQPRHLQLRAAGRPIAEPRRCFGPNPVLTPLRALMLRGRPDVHRVALPTSRALGASTCRMRTTALVPPRRQPQSRLAFSTVGDLRGGDRHPRCFVFAERALQIKPDVEAASAQVLEGAAPRSRASGARLPLEFVCPAAPRTRGRSRRNRASFRSGRLPGARTRPQDRARRCPRIAALARPIAWAHRLEDRPCCSCRELTGSLSSFPCPVQVRGIAPRPLLRAFSHQCAGSVDVYKAYTRRTHTRRGLALSLFCRNREISKRILTPDRRGSLPSCFAAKGAPAVRRIRSIPQTTP